MGMRFLERKTPAWIEMNGWNETDVAPTKPTQTLVGPVLYKIHGHRLWKNKHSSLKDALLKVYKCREEQQRADSQCDVCLNVALSSVRYCTAKNRFIIKSGEGVEHCFKLTKKKHFEDWIAHMNGQRVYCQYAMVQTHSGRSTAPGPSPAPDTTPNANSQRATIKQSHTPNLKRNASLPTMLSSLASSVCNIKPDSTQEPSTSQSQPQAVDVKKNDKCEVNKVVGSTETKTTAQGKVTEKKGKEKDDGIIDESEDSEEEEEDSDRSESEFSAFSNSTNSSESSVLSGKSESTERQRKKVPPRTKLPAPMSPNQAVSFGTIKEAAKGSLPVSLCEPLSFLQVMCEELEHRSFLDRAIKEKDAEKRISYILAFGLSFYASTKDRSRKPFNPKVGETFEMDRWVEEGWRFHAEQVARQPDTSSGHAEGVNGWVWWQSISLKANFTFQGFPPSPVLVAEATGSTGVLLRNFKETYHWNKVNSQIENLLNEDKHLVHFGKLKLSCSTGYSAEVTLEKNKTGKYKGFIKDVAGKTVCDVKGVWFGECELTPKNQKKYTIFQPKPRPPESKLYYSLSYFAMQLNILQPKEELDLPPSDSRFRKDIRLLEEGKFQDSMTTKVTIEKAIRARRDRGEFAKPLWFSKQDGNGINSWTTKGNYWKCKHQRFRGIQFNKIW